MGGLLGRTLWKKEFALNRKLSYAALSLIVLAVVFGPDKASTVLQMVIKLAMFVYIGAYQYSYGPITWLIIWECFPIAVRGQSLLNL